MSQGVPSVSSAEIGVASGLMGAGVGYILAPGKYNLEELLTIPADVFEKSVPKEIMTKQSATQKKAYQAIVEARDVLAKAVAKNAGEAKLAEFNRAPYLESAYKNIKTFMPKARTQSAVLVGVIAGFVGMAINYISNPRN